MLRARGPLPITEAVGFMLQACEAIAEAHALGIVHRDLKPANLFVTRRADGSPCIKVLDFGIGGIAADRAKRAAAETGRPSGLTTLAGLLSSSAYMLLS